MHISMGKHLYRGIVTVALTIAWIFVASFSAYAAEELGAVYSLYLNGKDWNPNCGDNTYCKAGSDTYATALWATLRNQPAGMTGTISYQVNLSGSGWLGWTEDSVTTGTTEGSAPLEAVRLRLTGQLAEQYDIYYSVYQNGAWTELVMNGETAGVEAQGRRVMGIRISVRKKGAGAPGAAQAGPRYLDPSGPMVALTFDDGPAPATTRILDTLEGNDARATFFMVGNRIPSYPSVVQRMTALGCEPASHTWDHSYLTKLSESAMFANLEQFDSTLQSIAGVRAALLRPPGGFVNDTVKASLAKRGNPVILWSIDTLDWKTKDPQNTVNVVLNTVQDGDIILMHDLYGTTADAVAALVPELKNRGYQLVTVSELASLRGGLTPGKSYGRILR